MDLLPAGWRTALTRAFLPVAATLVVLAPATGAGTVRTLLSVCVGLSVALGLAWESRRRLQHWLGEFEAGDGGGRTTVAAGWGGRAEIDELGEAASQALRWQRAERSRLVLERDRLEAILAGMAEAVVVLDRTGEILRTNTRVTASFGLDPGEQLVGRRLAELLRDPGLRDLLRTGLAGHETVRRELVIDAGGLRHLEVSLAPTGQGSTWVLLARDISETRRLEQVKTDFVANVSHELRTPLTAIKGFAETLIDSGTDDPVRTRMQLEIIDRHAERLGRLIDDLLILSDLEMGRMPLRARDVDLASAVADALALLGPRAAARGVRIDEENVAGGRLHVDPDRLSQVLINLVDNAVKFSPEGGTVVIAAAPSAAAEGWVALRVSDRGRGIPQAEIPRLAERFYRVDRARSRELGGTGLGLSIVKHIVRAHGGRLAIESELGRGTRVTVEFPGRAGLAPLPDPERC